jgi:hypothetical protein
MDQKPSFGDVQKIQWVGDEQTMDQKPSLRVRMTASDPLFVRLVPIVLSVRLQMTASNPLFVRLLPIVLSLCIFQLFFGKCDAKYRTFQLQSYFASAIKQRFKTQVNISDPD